MHGMIFTFGIRNYFSFTFSLQLGSPSPAPTEEEQPDQRASPSDCFTVMIMDTDEPHAKQD